MRGGEGVERWLKGREEEDFEREAIPLKCGERRQQVLRSDQRRGPRRKHVCFQQVEGGG